MLFMKLIDTSPFMKMILKPISNQRSILLPPENIQKQGEISILEIVVIEPKIAYPRIKSKITTLVSKEV